MGKDVFKVCREFQKNTGYFSDDTPDPTRTFAMEDYPGAYKTYDGTPVFDLPRSDYSDNSTPIGAVMALRRSKRNFLSDALTLDDLGFLLWATQGITAEMPGYQLRTAPSAGALYPIETYLVVRAVEGLPEGIYHLDVRGFRLEQLKEGSFCDKAWESAHQQEMVRLAAVNFFWSARLERCVCKYFERAYRYIYEDVGHISQNLQLAATALDSVGAAVIGAYLDDLACNLLDLDIAEEPVVMMGSVGKVTGTDFREDRRTYLEKMRRAREEG
jgi:SagB-type dehydrogenase family enzyme